MKPLTLHSLVAAVLAAMLAGCAPHNAAPTNQPVKQVTAANAQVVRKALAPALYEVAYSAKQHAAFVASAGGHGEDAPPSRILRLHPETLAVQAEILLERRGYGMALDDAAGRLYVGNGSDASVTIIDVATNTVTGVVQLAQKIKATTSDGKKVERFPHSFRQLLVDAANHRLYLPGMWFQDSALYVVDTQALKVEKVIPGMGFLATGIAQDEAGGKVYVSNLAGQLYTVDTQTLAVNKAEAGGDQLLNLVYDRDGKRVLATDQGAANIDAMRSKRGGLDDYSPRGEGNRVVALSPADGKLLASLPTGEGPVALLLDESRKRLFVTNRGAGTVSVFDNASNQLLQTIALPTHPNSLALDSKRNVLYVTIKNGEKDPKGGKESVARIQF